MTTNLNKRLYMFIKVLTSYMIQLTIAFMFIVVLRAFMNLQLFQKDDMLFVYFFIIFGPMVALFVHEGYLDISRTVKIDDKLSAQICIKQTMKKMRWRNAVEEACKAIYRYPLSQHYMRLKITILFKETEMLITGPNVYVDELIEKLDFHNKASA